MEVSGSRADLWQLPVLGDRTSGFRWTPLQDAHLGMYHVQSAGVSQQSTGELCQSSSYKSHFIFVSPTTEYMILGRIGTKLAMLRYLHSIPFRSLATTTGSVSLGICTAFYFHRLHRDRQQPSSPINMATPAPSKSRTPFQVRGAQLCAWKVRSPQSLNCS